MSKDKNQARTVKPFRVKKYILTIMHIKFHADVRFEVLPLYIVKYMSSN